VKLDLARAPLLAGAVIALAAGVALAPSGTDPAWATALLAIGCVLLGAFLAVTLREK
jgi:type IV secretory pathway VirB2 component (pilin)